MARVRPGLGAGTRGRVDLLVVQFGPLLAHPPQLQATRIVLFMEVQIPPVARVADLLAPHQTAGVGVAQQNLGRSRPAARGDPVGVMRRERDGRAPACPTVQIRHQRGIGSVRQAGEDALNGLPVNTEKRQAAGRHVLLKPAPQRAVLLAVGANRRKPVVAWTIAAFRQPHAGRATAKVGFVAGGRQPQLQANALLAGQQGQIAVGRRRGQQFDVAVFHQLPKGGQQIAVKSPPLGKPGAVQALPVIHQIGNVGLALGLKIPTRIGTRPQAGVEEELEFGWQEGAG